MSMDDLEKAAVCFRNAIQLDERVGAHSFIVIGVYTFIDDGGSITMPGMVWE